MSKENINFSTYHGIDARYTGPHSVSPTITARFGTGGNNTPIVSNAVFSRQRVDVFHEGGVVSTQSARQYKDATDLIYQKTVGALTTSDSKGPNTQYVSSDKLVVEAPLLIRRLTPRECERLQGLCSAKKNAKLFVEAAKIGANPQIALHNSMAWVILWSTV